MNHKFKELMIGLLFASILGGALLVPAGNIANFMFLIFFLGSGVGLLGALRAPLSSFSGKGIMWEHYIPQTLIIILMFISPFPYLGYVFCVIAIILIIKNLLANERYENHNIT